MKSPPFVKPPAYESPKLTVVGTVHALTLDSDGGGCYWNKTIGPPDFVNWIPISNCSP